jgi:hypothetical protein
MVLRGQLRKGLQECEIQGKDQEHPVGCRVWREEGCIEIPTLRLNKERREKGKTAPRAVEVVNLGFASDLNTSAYKVLACEGDRSDTYLQSAGAR